MRLLRNGLALCTAIFLVLVTGRGIANAQSPQVNPPASTVLAFVHANVIPMDQDRVLPDQTVVIENGRITRVGATKSTALPPLARKIDATGKYLIPGLVDMHVHLQSQIEFPVYLANGVTTVFNLDGRPAHLRWRDEVAKGQIVGPTIFSTGPMFRQKRTAGEDVKLVDEQAVAGYDAIKVYNEVSKEEYPALIAEAKRKNLLLMGHVARGPGFATTLQAGQSIAHLEEVIYTNFNPQNDDEWDHLVFDESRIPGTAHRIKDAHIYLIATLNNFALIVQQATDLDTFLKNPELHYDAPWTLENLQPDANRYKNRFETDKYQILRNLLAIQRNLLKALSDASVPLLAGTDATEIGPVAGFGLHHELEEFVQDGLTPYQSLRAAMATPASYFHQAKEFGTIEVGKRGDMVLLDDNPLSNISNTQKIAGIVVRGRWQDKSELSANLEAVPAAYQREQAKVEAMLRDEPARVVDYLTEHDPLGRLAAFAISARASHESVTDLVEMLQKVRAANPQAEMVSEDSINNLGYGLMGKKLYPQAVAVLSMNTKNYPRAPNTWDSLADAFAHSGDSSQAVQNYQKALDTDSGYPNAEFAKKFVAEHKN